MISNIRLSGCFAAFMLCLTFPTESRGSVEETKAFEEKLADIARLDTIRRRMSESDHKPREKSYHEKCVENAVRLALRNPDSELSHAVYANIIEERVAESQYDEALNRVLKARQKNLTNEFARYSKQFEEQEDYREKLSEKLWQTDLFPIAQKTLFKKSDCQIYVPKSVVKEEDSVQKGKEGYVLYSNESGPVRCGGFEIGSYTNSCSIISHWEGGRVINCRMNEDFLGRKTCSVLYSSSGRITGLKFSFCPSTRAEYEKTLDDIVNKVREKVECRNRSFLYSEESLWQACFALHIYKGGKRYGAPSEAWLDL